MLDALHDRQAACECDDKTLLAIVDLRARAWSDVDRGWQVVETFWCELLPMPETGA